MNFQAAAGHAADRQMLLTPASKESPRAHNVP